MSLLVLIASCDVIVFFEIITKSQKHIESNNRNMNSTMLLMSIHTQKHFQNTWQINSKLTIVTLEKRVRILFQVNNNSRSGLTFSSVSIVDFKQVNVSWVEIMGLEKISKCHGFGFFTADFE